VIVLFNQYYKDPNIQPTLPINLLSIASYMNSKSIPTKVYEAENDKNIINIIQKERPFLVGIGCQFTYHYDSVLKMARTIKQYSPKLQVAIGGNHASSLNKLDYGINHIIKGEGEASFFDLARGKVGGIVSPYPLMDIDSLPEIDYSLIDFTRYTKYSPFSMRLPVMNIITSRGCPNDCIYCTVKGVWGRTWRGKSPEKVLNEIRTLVKMGFKEFNILDDSASVDRKRWIEICKGIREFNIKWCLPNGVAHWTLDKDVLKLMKEAGCYRLTFGIESANNRVRKFIRKSYPVPYGIIKEANKLGMWTQATNILGFPNETKSEMTETLNFSIKSGVDFSAFFPLDAYPTADISKYKLDLTLANKMQLKFYRRFFIHKLLTCYTIVNKIHSFEDLKYTLKLVFYGVKIIFRTFYKKTTKGIFYGRDDRADLRTTTR